MNYTSFIVKIVGKPEQSFFHNNIIVTEMIVQFVPARQKPLNTKDIFQISVWSNSNYDTTKYYMLNDYVIIEGYVSLRPSMVNFKSFKNEKQIEISIVKLHPFFLN